MNTALRKVAVAVLVLFGLLLGNLNYVQVVAAERLKDHPSNSRVLVDSYSRQRGPIVAGNEPLANSVETDGRLRYLRRYPGGPLYAHLTGYYSLVYGQTGLEHAHDDVLSGAENRFFVQRLSDIVTGRTSRGGAVELTIDRALQETAAAALAGRRGAVVALDPRTGAVLAMVSNPSYDPNALASHEPKRIREAFERLAEDASRPLVNRAAQSVYPPGSTFKVVTAAAALEKGLRPESLVDSPPAYRLPNSRDSVRNFGGSGCGADRITLAEAFQRSCNADFAKIGADLGAATLQAQAERFGFNSRPDFPLQLSTSVYPERIDAAQTALTAIGQYDLRATPLQMAMVAAGIANRGVVMRPYLVSRLLGPELEPISTTTPRAHGEEPAVSPGTATALTALMESVVGGPFGTGKRAAIPGVRVAGKTGTAQHGEGRAPHAWFVGFAPADAPRVAVAVLVEAGGDLGSEATGGQVAAPIARAVMERALR